MGKFTPYDSETLRKKSEQWAFDAWLERWNAPHDECCDEVEQRCYRGEEPMPLTDDVRALIAEQAAKAARIKARMKTTK